jgi:DNA-binding response OmpR family regulator
MPKVLIVEDDPIMGKMLLQHLEREHYTVEFVDNAESALAILAVADFDLIVVDWGLPGRSGIDVIDTYRSAGGKSPILMLTAKNAIEEKEKGFSSGSDDYLTKPFHPKELTVRLRALLRRTTDGRQDILRLGSLSLDPSTRKVMACQCEIDLPPIEFRLLEFLMRSPGTVFSLQALMNRVWTSDATCSEDSVRMCVARLRSKLRGIEGGPNVETVHGSGYCLELKQSKLV